MATVKTVDPFGRRAPNPNRRRLPNFGGTAIRRMFMWTLVLVAGSAWTGLRLPQAQARTLVAPPAFSGPFRHPGILLNTAQLSFIKQQVNAGAEPWKTAFANVRASTWGSLTYQATPYSQVSSSNVASENALRNDSQAAYTQALLWYVTGNATYAQNAIAIMNAWSSTLTGGFVGSGQQVFDAAWGAANFPRAAEIIRYLYPSWATAGITEFGNMLTTQFLPTLPNGQPFGFYGGNQNNSIAEARMNIAIFNDDVPLFNSALNLWRADLPAYLYMSSDGPLPACPINWGTHCTATTLAQYWHNAPYVDGMTEETYRDLGHVQWGIAALEQAAETAYQQGVDLWSETTLGTLNAKRLAAALELNAGYINGPRPPSVIRGSSVGTWEIAYNHLVNRLCGYSLPNTARYLASVRPTGASYFINWQTLTHYDQGMNGFGPRPSCQAATSPQRAPEKKPELAKTGAAAFPLLLAGTTLAGICGALALASSRHRGVRR